MNARARACRLKTKLATKPITWKKGVKQTVPACSTPAAKPAGMVLLHAAANHRRAWCEWGTAFGVPVVPPVKKTAAGS